MGAGFTIKTVCYCQALIRRLSNSSTKIKAAALSWRSFDRALSSTRFKMVLNSGEGVNPKWWIRSVPEINGGAFDIGLKLTKYRWIRFFINRIKAAFFWSFSFPFPRVSAMAWIKRSGAKSPRFIKNRVKSLWVKFFSLLAVKKNSDFKWFLIIKSM